MFQGYYQSARICLTSRGVEIEEMQSQVLIMIFVAMLAIDFIGFFEWSSIKQYCMPHSWPLDHLPWVCLNAKAKSLQHLYYDVARAASPEELWGKPIFRWKCWKFSVSVGLRADSGISLSLTSRQCSWQIPWDALHSKSSRRDLPSEKTADGIIEMQVIFPQQLGFRWNFWGRNDWLVQVGDGIRTPLGPWDCSFDDPEVHLGLLKNLDAAEGPKKEIGILTCIQYTWIYMICYYIDYIYIYDSNVIMWCIYKIFIIY